MEHSPVAPPLTIATNLWFGSPNAERLTAGTHALREAYSAQAGADVHEQYVDCSVPGASALDAAMDGAANQESAAHGTTARGIRNFAQYKAAFTKLRDTLNAKKPARVTLLGGGCAATLAVIPYLARLHPGMRLIWIDAHGDLNSPDTSRSGYIHGMALGILLDPASYGLFFADRGTMDPARVALAGQKELDPAEALYAAAADITTLPLSARFEHALHEFLGESEFLAPHESPGVPETSGGTDQRSPVYVHVDLDVLSPRAYLNPKCNIDAGPDIEELANTLNLIARHAEVIGYSIAENFETDAPKVRQLVEALTGNSGKESREV